MKNKRIKNGIYWCLKFGFYAYDDRGDGDNGSFFSISGKLGTL